MYVPEGVIKQNCQSEFPGLNLGPQVSGFSSTGHGPKTSPCAWCAGHAESGISIVCAFSGFPGGRWQIVIILLFGSSISGHGPKMSPCAWCAGQADNGISIVFALPGFPGGRWQIVIISLLCSLTLVTLANSTSVPQSVVTDNLITFSPICRLICRWNTFVVGLNCPPFTSVPFTVNWACERDSTLNNFALTI